MNTLFIMLIMCIKEFVSLGYGGIAFINKEIAFVKTLEAPDLVDAYKNGNLKGKLKRDCSQLR
mgnify:CR=1 FL=1